MNYSRKWNFRKNNPEPMEVSGKKPKVVFIAPFAQHQDTAHLLARFAIDARVIATTPSARSGKNEPFRFGRKDIYWPELATTQEQVFEQMRNALDSKPETIVIAPVPEWRLYPADIREKITAAAAGGGTLVIINNAPLVEELTGGAEPESEYAADRGGAGAVFFHYGCGRIIHYTVNIDERHGYFLSDSELESEFEYSIDFFAGFLFGTPDQINATIDGATLRVGKAENGTSCIKIRRIEDYSIVSEYSLEAGEQLERSLEDFPADQYAAELELYDCDGCLMDWKTLFFTIENALEITECVLSPETAASGDSLTVCSALKNTPSGLSMRHRWIDCWDRVLEESAPAAFVSPYRLNAPQNSYSVVNRLEIEFLDGAGKLLRIVPLELAMPGNAPQRDFPFLLWNLTDKFSWKQRRYLEALRTEALGNALCNCSVNRQTARYAALAGMRTVPYSAWFHKVGLEDCLFNSDWLGKTRERVEAAAVNHRDYGAIGYTLGDECYVDAFTKGGRFSAAEHVWADFRTYLKTLYADSIDLLNRQWETAFTGWDEVKFTSDSELLRSFDNPSPWTNFRMFIAHAFTERFRSLRDRIHELDPGAAVGWDGCEQYSSYDGIDWWEFSRDMEINVVYGSSTLGGGSGLTNRTFNSQAVKSFNPDARFSGAFLNSIDYRYGAEHSLWNLLLNGYKSIWWWHATYPDDECGALKWDLKPAKIVSGIRESLAEIRDGADTMLTHARKQYSPIAIHYSANNFHASTIESGVGNHINNIGITKTEFWMAEQTIGRTIKADAELMRMFGDTAPSGHYGPAFKNFYTLLKDIGFQPRTLARQQIEQDGLRECGARVLILPFTVSLSDREAAGIRAFVEGGGLLIADYRCGLRDLHGRMRAVPPLDDIFGIRRKSCRVVRGNSRVAVEYNFAKGGNFPSVFHDDLELTGSGCVLDSYDDGTPMANSGISVFGCHEDGSPAFIVNHFGRGKALLLNFDLYSYDHLRREQRHMDLLETFRCLLWKLAELRPEIVPEYENGSPVGTVETVRLKDRDNIYHGFLPEFAVFNKAPVNGMLEFGSAGHIYDARAHRYLGRGRQKTVFAPGKPLLFAELPDKITGIDLTHSPEAAPGEEIPVKIRVETHAGKKFPCTVKIEMFFPCGAVSEPDTQTLYLPDGSGVFTLFLPLNAPSGCWQLKCTEYISGLYVEAVIHVGSPEVPKESPFSLSANNS